MGCWYVCLFLPLPCYVRLDTPFALSRLRLRARPRRVKRGAPCIQFKMEESVYIFRHFQRHTKRVSYYIITANCCRKCIFRICILFCRSSERLQHTTIRLTNPYRKLPTTSSTLHRSSGPLKDVFVHLIAREAGMYTCTMQRAHSEEGHLREHAIRWLDEQKSTLVSICRG